MSTRVNVILHASVRVQQTERATGGKGGPHRFSIRLLHSYTADRACELSIRCECASLLHSARTVKSRLRRYSHANAAASPSLRDHHVTCLTVVDEREREREFTRWILKPFPTYAAVQIYVANDRIKSYKIIFKSS